MKIVFARHKANVQTRHFLHALMKVSQERLARIVVTDHYSAWFIPCLRLHVEKEGPFD